MRVLCWGSYSPSSKILLSSATALIVLCVTVGSLSLNALGRSKRFSTLNAAIFMADPPFGMELRYSYHSGPVWFFDYVDIAFVTSFSPLTELVSQVPVRT